MSNWRPFIVLSNSARAQKSRLQAIIDVVIITQLKLCKLSSAFCSNLHSSHLFYCRRFFLSLFFFAGIFLLLSSIFSQSASASTQSRLVFGLFAKKSSRLRVSAKFYNLFGWQLMSDRDDVFVGRRREERRTTNDSSSSRTSTTNQLGAQFKKL